MAAGLATELMVRLRTQLEAHRDPERALGARAYMRDQFDFYGIPAPVQQRVFREVLHGLPKPTERDLERVCRACWKQREREWQYFACGYLRTHVAITSAGFIDTAEHLIRTKSWWDTVDSLASRTVGPLVLAHPELVATMQRWIGSDNIWIARTAIIHQLSFKERTDPDRLFGFCLRRADEKEFFIKKAIGWALREYSKTDGDAVRRFVSEHSVELSGLSRTEALKWLERRGS